MKIIKQFNFNKLNNTDKEVLYKQEHPLCQNNKIDDKVKLNIPAGNCIWVDSAVYCLKNTKYIGLENKHFASVFNFDSKQHKIHFSYNLSSALTLNAMQKVYKPTSFVFYFSPLFKYLTINQVIGLLNTYKEHSPQAKLILAIDLIYLLYHRIKYTNDDIVALISAKKTTRLDTFKYLVEF